MGDQDYPPWLDVFLQKQTDTISAVLDKHFSNIGKPEAPQSPPKKKAKSVAESSMPPESPPSHPQDSEDEDDEFERRFGHLIGNGSDMEDSHRPLSAADIEFGCKTDGYEDDDDAASVDDDLLVILNKVPNWDTCSSIRKFISDNADSPLPDDMLKKLNEDFIPGERIQAYFSPPEMPTRLYRSIARMKSKGALKTEKAMYSAQNELFVIAKPMIAALIELKPLGTQVSTARELLSISLRGIFSVSLKLSRARRENVRFLFKEVLADVLYNYAPRHCSLFGGDGFGPQVEKAAKEAKLDISWSKSRPSTSYQPFRNQGYQGFRYAGGASQYFQNQRGRRGGNRGRGSGYRGNKSGSQKSKKGSGSGKKE